MVDEAIRQYVIFRLGSEEYGLPIEQVSSIMRYEPSTPVPQAPDEVEGVLNLRGKVIPIVDLRRRFTGIPSGDERLSERIVVTESEAGSVGLAVDAASEVVAIPTEEIRPAPETVLTAETAEAFEGVANIEGRLIIILRLEKAMPHDDYVRLASQEGDDDV